MSRLLTCDIHLTPEHYKQMNSCVKICLNSEFDFTLNDDVEKALLPKDIDYRCLAADLPLVDGRH